MKKQLIPFVLFVFIFLLISSSFIHAQDTTAAAKPLDGFDRCWGMNFMWKKDFTLGKQKIGSYSIYNGESSQTKNWVSGFGLDLYLSSSASLSFIGSVGLDNQNSSNEGSTSDLNSTELGLMTRFNYCPMGMSKSVYYSVGPWFSVIYYNETQTNKQTDGTEGTEDKYEYSTSMFAFGVNATAYLRPWNGLNLEFYVGSNLGVTIAPASTVKTTIDGQTTKYKGPDIIQFSDCGGMVGTRFYFDAK